MRGRLDWRRWRPRVIAGIMVLTLLSLAAVAVYTYFAYQRAASALLIERDHQVAYLSAARLKDEMARYSTELVTLARTPAMYRDAMGEQLLSLGRNAPRLAVFDGGVLLLDRFGTVRAAVPERPDIIGDDWSDRPYFSELLASPSVHFSDASNDGPGGRAVVTIGVPILDESGGFVGVLAGMFGLDESRSSALYASIVRLRLGQAGNTYVIDGSGRVLYDSGYGRVGAIMELPRTANSELQGGAERRRDPEGNDVVLAYAPVPGTAWTLVTEDDWATLTNSTRRYARLLLAVLALGIVLPAAGMGLLMREHNAAMLERDRTEQEARVAELIRRKLLPRQLPTLPGWNLAACHLPGHSGGGSFHDFLLLPDGRLMLTVGDINERGLPAAPLMAMVRATCRGAARRDLPPAEVLECNNVLLCPELDEGHYVACAYGILDPATGRLHLANAGLGEPVLGRNGTGETFAAPGEPLGAKLESRYAQDVVTIEPGAFLLLCSSGLLNARNSLGDAFGSGRLSTTVSGLVGDADAIVESVRDALKEFTGRAGILQDITVLVLEHAAVDGPGGRDKIG